MMNRIHNVKNPWQGKDKKVLCVCSAGLLRSPTAAFVLAKEYGYNTRAVGLEKEFALICIDDVLLEWADEVVCMTSDQQKALSLLTNHPVKCLDIEDSFSYMDPELIELILQKYEA